MESTFWLVSSSLWICACSFLNYIEVDIWHPSFTCVFIFICRYIGKGDGITISVWNNKKIHKKQGGGFLGCVRILSSTVQRLKDTGCKYHSFVSLSSIVLVLSTSVTVINNKSLLIPFLSPKQIKGLTYAKLVLKTLNQWKEKLFCPYYRGMAMEGSLVVDTMLLLIH